MPELPEVETIRRALHTRLLGRRITRIRLLRKDYIRAGKKHLSQFSGNKLTAVDRRGKFLALRFSGGSVLLHHLGMSGRLLYTPSDNPLEPHTHVRIQLDDEKFELRQQDPRRFGFIALFLRGELDTYPPWVQLGPEPFDLKYGQFSRLLCGKNRPIKTLLLDQHTIAGLGNIYADESLFRAGIHPLQSAGEIASDKADSLLRSMKKVLHEAIRAGGTSINDYRRPDSTLGMFQNRLNVYGREGESCRKCGNQIMRHKLAGRSTYFCPYCQSSIHTYSKE